MTQRRIFIAALGALPMVRVGGSWAQTGSASPVMNMGAAAAVIAGEKSQQLIASFFKRALGMGNLERCHHIHKSGPHISSDDFPCNKNKFCQVCLAMCWCNNDEPAIEGERIYFPLNRPDTDEFTLEHDQGNPDVTVYLAFEIDPILKIVFAQKAAVDAHRNIRMPQHDARNQGRDARSVKAFELVALRYPRFCAMPRCA